MSKRANGRPPKRAPKRDNQTGSVGRTPDGRWRIQLVIGTKANGQPNRIDRLFRDEDSAREALAELRRQYADHSATGVVPTVAGVAQAWVKSESGAWEVSRRRIVADEVRLHIVEDQVIGHLPADRLGMLKVQDWLQGLADQGLRWPTIRTYKQHLSSAYTWATRVEGTRVHDNPVRRLNPKWRPRNITPDRDKTWLSLTEAYQLVAYCQRPEESWGPFFLTCAMLGLRPGEGFALRARDFDRAEQTVWIGRALKRDGDKADHIGDTKNSRGEPVTRTIVVDPAVLDAIDRQVANVELARAIYSDEWSDRWGDLLFVNTNRDRASRPGEIVVESNVRTNLDRICAAAGIPRVTPYELRHSCASILLHKKVHPQTVADMLGTSTRMLERYYRHLMQKAIPEGAAVWKDILDR